MPSKYVGLDGCAAGWVALALGSDNDFDLAVFPRFAEAAVAYPGSLILVDIPIGLRDSGAAERLCDRAARALLGPRASSVFPAPVRAALAGPNYEIASSINSEKTRSASGAGRRLSKQSFAILPKIREVDEYLAGRSSHPSAIREMHPELCFWALNGGRPLRFNKKTPEGRAERVGVLKAHLPGLAAFVEERVLTPLHRGVAADDIVDAAAGAATGFLSRGSPLSLPPDPERDGCGLPMEMVYYGASRQEDLRPASNDGPDLAGEASKVGVGPSVISFQPQRIPGRWRDGYALDLHTTSSTFVGHDEFGHARFDTQRSPAGELLNRLKYHGDGTAAPELIEAAVSWLRSWNPGIDMVVPVPASRVRSVQPVIVLGEAIANELGVEFCPTAVRRTRETPQLKDVVDYNERSRLLDGLHEVDREKVRQRRVLLFDDLFRSGATMNSIAGVIQDSGQAAEVFAMTVTRTRSHQ